MHINCDLLHGKVHIEGMKMLYRCIGKIEVNFIFLSLVSRFNFVESFLRSEKDRKASFSSFFSRLCHDLGQEENNFALSIKGNAFTVARMDSWR
jgi:hypothetical protein